MKINEQSFTERLSTPAGRTGGVGGGSGDGSSSTGSGLSSSDNLQLSKLASLLQNSQSFEAQRSARVSEIASAVKSNTFQFNAAQISSAMISEAAQPQGR